MNIPLWIQSDIDQRARRTRLKRLRTLIIICLVVVLILALTACTPKDENAAMPLSAHRPVLTKLPTSPPVLDAAGIADIDADALVFAVWADEERRALEYLHEIEHARQAAQAKKLREAREELARRVPTTSSTPASGSVWDRLAQCESRGDWFINTGNGYYGGLQFDLPTWQANGGTGYPHQNSKAEQIRVGQNLQAARGWSPWPACSKKLGLR